MYHKTRGDKIFDALNITFFILFAITALYPFWSTLMTSFMDERGYYGQALNLYPKGFNLRAWRNIFSTPMIYGGFINSILYTTISPAYTMFMVFCAAYAMTKPNLIGKRFFNIYFLITMYFGGGMVPSYLINTNILRLGNTRWIYFITGGLAVWGFLVLRNFIKKLSPSLIESARIDGATEFTILGRIVLPLSLPCITTLTMFQMIGYWNNWMTARIYLTTREDLYPLPMIIRRVVIEGGSRGYSAMLAELEKARQVEGQGYMIFETARDAAMVMCVVLPIVLVYPFIQKYFEKGVMIGSLKE